MGGAMKYFLGNLLGHETYRYMVSWDKKNFLKNLYCRPLHECLEIEKKDFFDKYVATGQINFSKSANGVFIWCVT